MSLGNQTWILVTPPACLNFVNTNPAGLTARLPRGRPGKLRGGRWFRLKNSVRLAKSAMFRQSRLRCGRCTSLRLRVVNDYAGVLVLSDGLATHHDH